MTQKATKGIVINLISFKSTSKSTTALLLALAYIRMGKRVYVHDADRGNSDSFRYLNQLIKYGNVDLRERLTVTSARDEPISKKVVKEYDVILIDTKANEATPETEVEYILDNKSTYLICGGLRGTTYDSTFRSIIQYCLLFPEAVQNLYSSVDNGEVAPTPKLLMGDVRGYTDFSESIKPLSTVMGAINGELISGFIPHMPYFDDFLKSNVSPMSDLTPCLAEKLNLDKAYTSEDFISKVYNKRLELVMAVASSLIGENES